MKKVIGLVLVGLGAFFLVLAPFLKYYAAPRLAVAPLACDPGPLCENGVSISPSTGLATVLFDPATLSPRTNVQLDQIRRVRPDQAASTGDNNRTVYDSFQNVTDPDGVTIDASTERIAFDGHTSVMINCCGANENGVPVTDFTGHQPVQVPLRHPEADLPVLRRHPEHAAAREVRRDRGDPGPHRLQVRADDPRDEVRRARGPG